VEKAQKPTFLSISGVSKEWRGTQIKLKLWHKLMLAKHNNSEYGQHEGRHAERWTSMDDVELDLRNRGVKRWRIRTLDITEWASAMRKAKAKLTGL
jgi:hypothetical protein